MNATQHLWKHIRTTLTIGSRIACWSKDKGLTGGSFEIIKISNNSLKIKTIKGTIVTISRSEFEKLLEKWTDYINGRISRSESGFKTYTLSVLHSALQSA